MIIDFKNNPQVIGVDEVGRGSLAGPVIVAAILADQSIMAKEVKDSKLLNRQQRQILYNQLVQQYPYAIAVVNSQIIDKINILNATKKAMTLAITELKLIGNFPVYIDGNQKPFTDDTISTIVKGDCLLKPISAASIIAKVTRDSLMEQYAQEYPNYGWAQNAGYGTKNHFASIVKYGVTVYHRHSFLRRIYQ